MNIGKTNNSSYNILAHQSHVPNRGPPGAQLDDFRPGRGEMPIQHNNHVPQSPMYVSGQTPRSGGYEQAQQQQQQTQDQGYDQGQGYSQESPRVDFREDPRYGSAQGRRNIAEADAQGKAHPPTYNLPSLTHLNFDDHSPPAHRPSPRRTNDLIDYSGNPVMRTSIGYQNMQRGYTDQDPHGFKYSSEASQGKSGNPTGLQYDPRFGHGSHEGHRPTGGRKGGALLFIRFPIGQGGTSNLIPAAQAFQRAKVHDVGGTFLGLARKTFDFGYENNSSEAVGVFHFPSIEKATLFFQLDPVIRQPDFPPPYGHSQMWIVCNAYLPDNMDLFNTFLLSEIELHPGKTKREFFENFQVDFEKYLSKNGVMPYVICSYGNQDRTSLRRHAYPAKNIVSCHLFQGLDHLKRLSEDETYCKFRSVHNQMALEKCSIFTLHKKL